MGCRSDGREVPARGREFSVVREQHADDVRRHEEEDDHGDDLYEHVLLIVPSPAAGASR
jgi:hypothetical protein